MKITTKTTASVSNSATPTSSPNASRTVPIPETLQLVPGYPDKLKIYQIAASRFWQVRCYEQTTGKTIKRSTGQTDKREALKSAKALYDQILFNRLNGVAMTKKSRFDICAKGMMEMQAARVVRNDISAEAHRNDQYFLDAKVLPEFRELDVTEISYDKLENFVAKIGNDLAGSSIQRYLGLIRKVLDYALNRNLLQTLPKFPKIPKRDEPRGWFTPKEYDALLKRAWQLVGTDYVMRAEPKAGQQLGNVVRRLKFTAELPHMIAFMVNSFIRPTDLKNMQHKHVEIVRESHTFLRLTLPESKGHDKPIVTLEKAVGVYEKLRTAHTEGELAEADHYVFMPEFENRNTALRRLQQQFNYLLDDLRFKTGPRGEDRTIYSLRHTCIMHRLLEGDNIDLLTLARNARTTVEMIERFYASQLTGEMNIDSLQSVRSHKGLQLSKSPDTDIPLKVQSGIVTLDLPAPSSAPLDLN
ncbi:hypothetical protein [Noviherbaspirillum sp.]|uniref:hypothetical protein n=1 Tax=Noviherbaspirillum sp. TaxID=1926288 RepID=UPI002FE00119